MFNYKVRLASLIREFPSFNCQVFFFFFFLLFFSTFDIWSPSLEKDRGIGEEDKNFAAREGVQYYLLYNYREKCSSIMLIFKNIYIYSRWANFVSIFGKFARYPIENSGLDGINANGKLVFLSFLLLFFFLSLSRPYNTFRDRFGSSVKSRTFRDVVTKLRALQLQTPNSPYDPALFRKPQSLYSWDDRATRFCGTSAPTEDTTPKLHFLRCGKGFPWFRRQREITNFIPVLSPSSSNFHITTCI